MTPLQDKQASLGRLFFAVALVAFGIQQFLYGDFTPGRAPAWPAEIPGRLVWAYVSGAVLIAGGLAIAARFKAGTSAIVIGVMIFVWALLRHLPGLVTDPGGTVITQTGKALALFGGSFAVAGSLSGRKDLSQLLTADRLVLIGRICLGAFLVAAGIMHFVYADFVATLVPAWIPGHHFLTYFTGVALIAGGVGLIIPKTVGLAASLSGLMILSWVVLLHIPRAFAAATEAQSKNEWVAVFEAIAMCGIAFVIAGSVRKGERLG